MAQNAAVFAAATAPMDATTHNMMLVLVDLSCGIERSEERRYEEAGRRD